MNTALEYAQNEARLFDLLDRLAYRPSFGYWTRLAENQKREEKALADSIHAFLGIIPAANAA